MTMNCDKGKTLVSPKPDLILLDLNMPRKDGRETLKEIKSNPAFRYIPVVVFTTSTAEEDVEQCYEMGANSFISKAAMFEDLTETMKTLGGYWFGTVTLPDNSEQRRAERDRPAETSCKEYHM
jgi:CheY-like chemotaxis protein